MPIKVLSPRKQLSGNSRELRFTLPYPPSQNRYWRSRAVRINGKWVSQTYVSTEAKQYKAAVRGLVSAMRLAPFPADVEIAVEVMLYRPRRVGDVDNRVKVLFDALNGVAYADDKQIKKYAVERFEDKTFPRVEIFLKIFSERGCQ